MSNNDEHVAMFRVAYHDGSGIDFLDVKGTDYEVSDGVLHIAGGGEAAVFASGAWVFVHGTPTDSKEN